MRITNWKHFPWFVFVCLATIAAGSMAAIPLPIRALSTGVRIASSGSSLSMRRSGAVEPGSWRIGRWREPRAQAVKPIARG